MKRPTVYGCKAAVVLKINGEWYEVPAPGLRPGVSGFYLSAQSCRNLIARVTGAAQPLRKWEAK